MIKDPDKLVRAIQGDLSLLRDIDRWLTELEQYAYEAGGKAIEVNEMLRWQGEARSLRKLKNSLVAMTRVKDGAEDKSGTRSNGRGVSRSL